jgi:hypothetical protein
MWKEYVECLQEKFIFKNLHRNKLRVESTRKCVKMTRLHMKFIGMRVDFYIYILLRHARVWFQHAECDFDTLECDFDTHECHIYTHKCDLNMHECNLDTQTCYCNTLVFFSNPLPFPFKYKMTNLLEPSKWV